MTSMTEQKTIASFRVAGRILLGAILTSIIGVLIFNLATIYLKQSLNARFLFESIDVACLDFQRADGFDSLPVYFIWFSIRNVFSSGILKEGGIQIPNLTYLLPVATFGGVMLLPKGKTKYIGLFTIICVIVLGLVLCILSAFAMAHGVCA
jgi:hypothetical protein